MSRTKNTTAARNLRKEARNLNSFYADVISDSTEDAPRRRTHIKGLPVKEYYRQYYRSKLSSADKPRCDYNCLDCKLERCKYDAADL